MPKARVLAVDDQRYFRELVESLLTEAGFEAQTASSGEEALRILEQSHFDVVVTDLVMPGMDGSELVHRVKQRDPDQEIVVVTGVVDVKTAVEAMKLGATDYLLKPFDRTTLSGCLESILQRRRLKTEHERLLAENIEYLGERSLFERALRLFSRLSLGPLAEEIIEGLCLETQAQRGVLWTLSQDVPDQLDLAAARGLVRVEEEPQTLDPGALPVALPEGSSRVLLGQGGTRSELVVVMRSEGQLIGFARLGDKLGGDSFDPVDAACADRFSGFAEAALANAMRFRGIERRSLQDPTTGAYIFPYLEDVTRNEIEKANRFGRSFSLLALDLGPLDGMRRERGDAGLLGWLGEISRELRGLLRATDLLAMDASHRFWALLPEADALGASHLKERARELLGQSPRLRERPPGSGPAPEIAVATFPGDGTQLEALVRRIEERLEESRRSRQEIERLEGLSFGDGLRALLEQGGPVHAAGAAQITRFLLEEVARRPAERRLLFVGPGRALEGALTEGLEALRGVHSRAEIAVMSEAEKPPFIDARISWVAPPPAAETTPFVVHFGDGSPYALVRDEGDGENARLFHTRDRGLVEHLALRLRRELDALRPFTATGGAGT